MIVLYKGSVGKGKTLAMTFDAYKYFKAGYRIISNMKNLAFGDYLSSSEVLKLNRNSELFNCVLVLDEVQLFFDSRNFSKQENKDFSYFVQQRRKRNIIILCTSQFSNTIDLRLRQHVDFIAVPFFCKKSLICRVKYFNLTVFEDSFSNSIPLCAIVYFDSRVIFTLYNTAEMLT